MKANGFVKIQPAWSRDPFDWTRRARIVSVDGYQPPLYPDRLYDPGAIVSLAEEVNADVIRITAMGKLAYFNTDKWETDNYIGENDFIGEIVRLSHQRGIKVVAYIPGAHHLPIDLLLKWHPEWIQRNYPGQPPEESAGKYHSGTFNGSVCPIGPYRDFFREMLEKVIIKRDIDGWYTDGWKNCYFNTSCYCEACHQMFLQDTGNDLYGGEFLPGAAREGELKAWYHKKLVHMVQEMHVMVRRTKRLPTMLNNISGVLGCWPQGTWAYEIDSMHDVAHFERKTDPYNRLASAGYISLKGQRAWFYAGIYSRLHTASPETDGEDFAERNYADERTFPFNKELYNECMIAFACGQAVNCYRFNSMMYDAHAPGKQVIKDVFALVRDNPEIFAKTEYYPFAAVLDMASNRYEFKELWQKALVRQGIQAAIVKDKDISDPGFLRKFAVIVTKNIPVEQQLNMLEYVRQGGRWITADDVYGLALPGAVYGGDFGGLSTIVCGRGIIVRVAEDISEVGLLEAVRFSAGNYLPYRVEYAKGEIIPILTFKDDLWVLHLINISRHFTGNYESGLDMIPKVENISIEFSLPDGTRPTAISLLKTGQYEALIEANKAMVKIGGLDEYNAVVLRFEK